MASERAQTPSMVGTWTVAASLLAFACGMDRPPPPSQDLGTVDFPVSCGPEFQSGFNRAVALLHHMTYPEARQAFEEIANGSPGCAMAHWGIAMTLFQPLWPTRPGPEALQRGWTEVRKAQELGAPTARERLFIAMAEAFFRPGHDYWARISAWESAARDLHESFPRDHDAAAFHALAHLATAPPSGGTQHQDSAAGMLARILDEQPTHPGAVHYTIHADDVAGRERKSLDVVRRYLTIAPNNPHALHMPTHIFVRLGAWEEVIEWNRRAAEAALRHPAGDQGQWIWDEFPHAVEYLVYAHLQRGDDPAARQAMTWIQSTPNLEPSFKTAFHLSSIPARHALERAAWSDAASLPARPDTALPWDRFPWPEAVTWFARGLGSIRSGDQVAALEAETRLNRLRAVAQQAGEELFSRQIEILRLEVSAWLAAAGGRDAEAIRLMRAAVVLERETPKNAVTPAPTLPAGELLGDLLMQLGRTAEALESYRASIAATPGRLNGVLGAARAAQATGDTAAAAAYFRLLRGQVIPDSPRAGLLEATAFPARH